MLATFPRESFCLLRKVVGRLRAHRLVSISSNCDTRSSIGSELLTIPVGPVEEACPDVDVVILNGVEGAGELEVGIRRAEGL